MGESMKLPPPPISLRVLLSHARVVWKHWDVQSMVLTSFFIQLFLIFLAPFRKKTSNRVLIASVWLAYLLADWVAIQSIGLISNPCGSLTGDNELYAFWAQFLLLHLGGPDTITALALEDNELWLRTSLHLAVQIYGGLGILVKSVAHSQSSLWLPAVLMFTAGVIKYMERLSSLFHGRLLKLSSFFPDVIRWTMQRRHEGLYPEVELVRDCLLFFQTDTGLYAGRKLFRDSDKYKYMCDRTPEEAFTTLYIQLNLAYEAFYTKTLLICTKWRWKALRLAVTVLQLGCLVIWLFFTDKEALKEYNIRITYVLLLGAIAVDVFAIIRIQLLSCWAITLKLSYKRGPLLSSFYNMILSARTRTWGRYMRREDAPLWDCFRRALFRRWSESIPQLSLLCLCANEQSNKVFRFLVAWEGIKQRQYICRKWFSNHLRDFIYEDLKAKANTRGAMENIGKVKGGWACWDLKSEYEIEMIDIPIICELLDVHGEYYKILIQWHIITELCYHGDHLSQVNNNATNTVESGNNINSMEEECNYKEICKTLSDYLMYLLIHCQDMMSLHATANDTLFATYKDMKLKLNENLDSKWVEKARGQRGSKSGSLGCEILRYYFQSPEFNICDPHRFPIEGILGELEELENKQIGKWKFMAKVWSELLYYAAIQCKPNLHASNLKQGGELLSCVWLFLAYMGFGLSGIGDCKPEKAVLYESDIERCSRPVDLNF